MTNDRGWGTPTTGTPAAIPSDDRAGRERHRAGERARRVLERADAAQARAERRAAERDAAARQREEARDTRRIAEDATRAARLADRDARPKRRSTGALARTGDARVERDTRHYATAVDLDRIRTLRRRGATIAGLATAFGLSEDAVEDALREE